MYRCEVCQATSQPGQAQMRQVLYQPGGKKILRELPVCASCKTLLDGGAPLEMLKKQKGKVLIPKLSERPRESVVKQPKRELLKMRPRNATVFQQS